MKRLLLPGRGHKWYVNLKDYYEFDAATARGLERVVDVGDPAGCGEEIAGNLLSFVFEPRLAKESERCI